MARLGRAQPFKPLVRLPPIKAAVVTFSPGWVADASQICLIMLRKNVASQVVTFNLVNATTGAALTGATVTTKVALDGTQSAGAGTVTELGTGQYKYVPTQGETNGASVGFSFTATNAVPVNLHCFTIGQDPALSTLDVNATKWLGGTIPAVNVTGVPLVDLKYTLGTISPATAGSVRADSVTGAVGSVTGAVGSVTGAVGSVTGAVGSVTGAVGSVTGAVGSIAAGGIANASFAADTGKVTIRSGTAQAGAATTITLDASASASNSFYNNDLILLTGGAGAGQARFITAYVGATKVATVATWVTNPDNTTTFAILPFDAVAGATAPTTAQIATAVWQDLLAGSDFGTASSIGKLLKDDIDAAVSSRMATYTQPTGFLAATFPSGTVANTTNITTAIGISVGIGGIAAAAFAANAIDSAALATSAAQEIRDTILSDATTFAGASIAAIKAKTDNLPEGIKKNTALANFEFFMADSADHVTGKTGLTVAVAVSLDGGAFAPASNTPATEVANGIYKINLAAPDLNALTVTIKCTSAGADATMIALKTTL